MKKFRGKVVSLKMQKTAVVETESWRVHPIYKKRFRRNRRYPVDNSLELHIGDFVEFVETRPISKTKKWKITKIVASKFKSKSKIGKSEIEKKAKEK